MLDHDTLSVRLQAALMTHDLTGARQVLDLWPEDGELRSRIERDVWVAVLDHLNGNRAAATSRVRKLLREAEGDGHIQLFLDSGAIVRHLVREAAVDTPSSHVARLLDAMASSNRPTQPSAPGIVEELSERELEVLRYLPSRLSTKEISAQLYISRNTLKTHLQRIYRKLGVTSRDDAVQRSFELELA
jgi:LuxR family maltose regulon positive regulatory protein